jgi:hypothetical protein
MATAKKSPGKAIVKWEERFAAAAKVARAQVKNIGSGVGVKFGRGSISVGGSTVPGGKLNCVVIGSCALNSWYEADYDPNDAQPPDCYAFSTIVGDPEMAPHEEALNKQADQCAGCPKNEFGTAKVGRGKACGNNVRLALITEKDAEDADNIASAELATAKISPTNVKHWAGYVKMLDDEHGRPPWSVVTEIASFDDPQTQIRLEFRLVDLITDNATLEALEARGGKVNDELMRPFPPPVERAKKPVPSGRAAKFAGGKATPPVKGRR